MTTDDGMREIEAALEQFATDVMSLGPYPDHGKLLALIRQKLEAAQKPATSAQPAADVAQNDAEHERAVEAWRRRAMAMTNERRMFLLEKLEIDEALRLMRARPAIEVHSFTGTDSSYEKLVAREAAAGDLLRAAKTALDWLKHHGNVVASEPLSDAIEAAERAGVR